MCLTPSFTTTTTTYSLLIKPLSKRTQWSSIRCVLKPLTTSLPLSASVLVLVLSPLSASLHSLSSSYQQSETRSLAPYLHTPIQAPPDLLPQITPRSRSPLPRRDGSLQARPRRIGDRAGIPCTCVDDCEIDGEWGGGGDGGERGSYLLGGICVRFSASP